MDEKTKSFLVALQHRLKDEGKPYTLEDALAVLVQQVQKKFAKPKPTPQEELNNLLVELEGNFPDPPTYSHPSSVRMDAKQEQHPPNGAKVLAAVETRRVIREHCRSLTVVSVAGVLVGGVAYVNSFASAVAGLVVTIVAAVYAKVKQKEIQYLESTYRLDPRS